jgi:hypothetical protein
LSFFAASTRSHSLTMFVALEIADPPSSSAA